AVVLAFAAAACLSLAPVAAAPAKTAPAARPAAKGKAASDAPAAGATSSTTSGIETEARNAYIIDFRTGAVLLDKNADERIPPASMSKMMFYYTVFSYLKDGKAKLDDMLPV